MRECLLGVRAGCLQLATSAIWHPFCIELGDTVRQALVPVPLGRAASVCIPGGHQSQTAPEDDCARYGIGHLASDSRMELVAHTTHSY